MEKSFNLERVRRLQNKLAPCCLNSKSIMILLAVNYSISFSKSPELFPLENSNLLSAWLSVETGILWNTKLV